MIALALLFALAIVGIGAVIAGQQRAMTRRQARIEAELASLRTRSGVGPGVVLLGIVILGGAVIVSTALLSTALVIAAAIFGASLLAATGGGIVLAHRLTARQEQAIEAQFDRWLAPRAPLAYGPPELPSYCRCAGDAAVEALWARCEQREGVR
jgi:hypothetical protein